MLRFSKSLPHLTFNEKEFNRAADIALRRITRQGARAWLTELLSIGIPVDTGMAKGALLPIGRYLSVAVTINPQRQPYFHKLEGAIASPPTGALKSTFSFTDDSTNLSYGFEWTTDIIHFWTSTHYRGSFTPGDISVFQAGVAWDNYVIEALANDFPNMLIFMEFDQ